MASSQEVLASPHEVPAGPGQREYWADNLRVLVIAVVVVWHTAMAYLGGTGWYYIDRTTSKVWAAAVTPAWIIAGYALGPLFLVAGCSPPVPWQAGAPVRSLAPGCCGLGSR
jgi:hypothetical protein